MVLNYAEQTMRSTAAWSYIWQARYRLVRAPEKGAAAASSVCPCHVGCLLLLHGNETFNKRKQTVMSRVSRQRAGTALQLFDAAVLRLRFILL